MMSLKSLPLILPLLLTLYSNPAYSNSCLSAVSNSIAVESLSSLKAKPTLSFSELIQLSNLSAELAAAIKARSYRVQDIKLLIEGILRNKFEGPESALGFIETMNTATSRLTATQWKSVVDLARKPVTLSLAKQEAMGILKREDIDSRLQKLVARFENFNDKTYAETLTEFIAERVSLRDVRMGAPSIKKSTANLDIKRVFSGLSAQQLFEALPSTTLRLSENLSAKMLTRPDGAAVLKIIRILTDDFQQETYIAQFQADSRVITNNGNGPQLIGFGNALDSVFSPHINRLPQTNSKYSIRELSFSNDTGAPVLGLLAKSFQDYHDRGTYHEFYFVLPNMSHTTNTTVEVNTSVVVQKPETLWGDIKKFFRGY